MSSRRSMVGRSLPALLMASSVALLSAGVFAFAPPLDRPAASPTALPGDPNFVPTPGHTAASASPGGPLPQPPSPSPLATPRATADASPGPAAPATRVVIPSLGVDLAVVAGDLEVPGNRDNYPLCDVAQYLNGFVQPGDAGTTYVYAHARSGMFLPLLSASERNDGAELIGSVVEVYTADDRLHVYEIDRVKRHATDLSMAFDLPPGGHQLILQTSEGPAGTIPKLQVRAQPLSVVAAPDGAAHPVPSPRACPP
jgi:hypothetical protein